MADVNDVDEDLRPLARLVPVEARANMNRWELSTRCEYAASLLGDAETASTSKAERLKGQAGKILKSLSADAFAAERTRLDNELADAHRRGDDQAAFAIMSDIGRLRAANPQVPAERVLPPLQRRS